MVRALLAAVVVMAITAVGDTVSVAASGGTSSIQPASGEVWDLTTVAGDRNTSSSITLYDGTDESTLFYMGNDANATDLRGLGSLRIVLTNSQYARLRNDSTSALEMGYRGVKL